MTPKMTHSDGDLMLGIDLGGTKILAAVVDSQGRMIGRAKRKTRPERGVDEVIQRIAKTAFEAVEDAKVSLNMVRGVGIGAPGVANFDTGVIEFAPNLNNWTNVPLRDRLQDVLGLPVMIENDVNAGTFGEAMAGAGRGYSSVVGVFPGTGIGGGIVLDGILLRGARHAAGEIGHMVLMADGPLCGCGRRGCAEAMASRTAIENDLRGEIRAGRHSLMKEWLDLESERITSGHLARALEVGDPLVTDVLTRAAYHLGLLTGSVVNAVDPACVVFGGGLIEACGGFIMPIIRQTTYRHLIRPVLPENLPVLEAALGDYATVTGAAMLVRTQIEHSPA